MRRSILTLVCCAAVANFLLPPPAQSAPKAGKTGKTAVSLADRREIFVDDFLVEEMKNVRLMLHAPHDEGEVFRFDKPWEGVFSGYCTILNDRGKYRAYYRGLPVDGKDGSDAETTCLAESDDGIHWTKPELGLYLVMGTRKNNVVLTGEAPASHNFSPMIDSNLSAPVDARYKSLAGEGKSGLFAYASPDGIHWKKMSGQAVITRGAFDSQNVSFWSESEKMYLCYFRTWTEGGYKGYRSVSRCTSADFIHWTDPVPMAFGDTPPEHLYTQQTSPYFRAPHIYVAIGGRFMPGRQVLTEEQAKTLKVNPKYFSDCSDAFFMTSRGGNRYDRTFMEAFIRPGIGLDNWVSRSNYPALNVVRTGPGEMSVYTNQDYAQPAAHLHRYSMRLDGFTSLSAPYAGGEVITRPFTFTGHELEINYATSAAGEIRFEIEDENGNPLPGYSFGESDLVIGNEITRVIAWKGRTDLHNLVSRTIRLRIRMKDADLYSIRFR